MPVPSPDTQALENNARQGDCRAQFQLALLCFRSNRIDEFRHWLQQAASQEFPPALYRLGIWRLSQTVNPVELDEAKNLVVRAADLGFLQAVRAMIAISARGVGVLPDWDKAISWLKKALQMRDPQVFREAGLLLSDSETTSELGHKLLTHAAMARDVHAAYHLGCFLGCNSATVGIGAFWLNQANQSKHPLADIKYRELGSPDLVVPNTNIPPLVWADSELVISSLAEPVSVPTSQFVLETPRARSISGVLTPWECDYLIARAAPRLEPAHTSDSSEKKLEASEYRDSSATKFWVLAQDIIIARIERKLALAAESPLDYGEDLVVLNYKPGERYHPHCDGFHPDLPEQAAEIDLRGQRIRTILVYLNEDYEGGETRFLHGNATFRGKKGQALVFENVNEEGAVDERSVHEGMPVKIGEKWLASKWLRNKSQTVL